MTAELVAVLSQSGKQGLNCEENRRDGECGEKVDNFHILNLQDGKAGCHDKEPSGEAQLIEELRLVPFMKSSAETYIAPCQRKRMGDANITDFPNDAASIAEVTRSSTALV